VRVIDGNTVEVYINGRQIGIGIIGIEVAEGNTSCGQQATTYLGELLSSNQVRFDEDPIAPAFDKRKRRMYRLVLPDGRSAAVLLAGAGLARPSGTGIEANDIAAAAAGARGARIGCLPGNGGPPR